MSSWLSHSITSRDGTQLHVETKGQGEPLVLFDGIMCEGHVWKYLVPYFSGNKLIHWHYPGHGQSGHPPVFSDLSPGRLAADINTILCELDVKKVVLVGHSFGVQVALETAFRYPELVKGMVLICGAPGEIVKTFNDSRVLETLLPLLGLCTRFIPRQLSKLWKSMPRTLVARLARRSDQINRRLIEVEDLNPYFEGLARTDIGCAVRMLEEADRHDMGPVLKEIQAPCLVIAGSKDRFTPSHRSRFMADSLPNATLFSSDKGTHSLPLEQPDVVNLKIAEFLSNI